MRTPDSSQNAPYKVASGLEPQESANLPIPISVCRVSTLARRIVLNRVVLRRTDNLLEMSYLIQRLT